DRRGALRDAVTEHETSNGLSHTDVSYQRMARSAPDWTHLSRALRRGVLAIRCSGTGPPVSIERARGRRAHAATCSRCAGAGHRDWLARHARPRRDEEAGALRADGRHGVLVRRP